jgi:chromosomal replication initiator protein
VPDPQAEEEWGLLLRDVQKEIDVSSLRIWFEGIVPVHLDDNTLTISVPNSFAQEYIESRFGVLLTEIHRRRNGGDARLEVVVGERA